VSVTWNGRTAGGTAVPDGDYRFHVRAVDGAGLPSDEVTVPVEVDSGVATEPLNVILLFHANQNLNLQGDTANDVCFHGLLEVLRPPPAVEVHAALLGHAPTRPRLARLQTRDVHVRPPAGRCGRRPVRDRREHVRAERPYSTHMWDNDRQVEVQREVIETMVGGSPVSFWNAERCWKQALVPLIAQNGYVSTWVETHILEDSGTAAPEFAVRKTRLGDDRDRRVQRRR